MTNFRSLEREYLRATANWDSLAKIARIVEKWYPYLEMRATSDELRDAALEEECQRFGMGPPLPDIEDTDLLRAISAQVHYLKGHQ